MNNLIEKLIKNFNEIKQEDNKPIKMSIAQFDEEFKQIERYGLEKLNNELCKQNFQLIFHTELPKELQCFTLEKVL